MRGGASRLELPPKETAISFVHVKPLGQVMNQRPGDPVARLVDAVRQAKSAVALLGTDARAVSAAVDDCIVRLLDDPIRVVRVRGLPGTPLTLSRIVEEIGAGQDDGHRVDDDELIVRVLATRSRGEGQVVLLLEQAELLPLPTLAFLQVALAVFGTRTPRLQLLFAGHPRFMPLIDCDELTPLRDRLDAVVRVMPPLAGLELGSPVPRRVKLGGMAATRTVAGPGRRRWLVAAPALMLAVAAAAMGKAWYGAALLPIPSPVRIEPPADAQPLPQAAQPSPAPDLPPQAGPLPQDVPPSAPDLPPQVQLSKEPPALPPQAAEPEPVPPPLGGPPDGAAAPQPERRALPSSEQLARLRGEFDRFLSQTEWGSKRLTENERSRLFNEYLRWNYGALAASPGAPP